MRRILLTCALVALLAPAQSPAVHTTVPAGPPQPSLATCSSNSMGIYWSNPNSDTFKVYRSRYNATTERWNDYTWQYTTTGLGYLETFVGGGVRLAVTKTVGAGVESFRSEPMYATCRAANPYPIRGLYIDQVDRDTSTERAALFDDGYNLLDTSAADVDDITASGMKGMVWLGGYTNGTAALPDCTWTEDDAWVEDAVADAVAGGDVGVFFVDDEPNVDRCPDFPEQLADRVAVIENVEPDIPTLIVTYRTQARVDEYTGHVSPIPDEVTDNLDDLVGITDLIGLDHYPCKYSPATCDYPRIDREARAMETACANASISDCNYLIVPEAFESVSNNYDYSATTIAEQFKRIRSTNARGYVTYAWTCSSCTDPLRDNSTARAVLASENGR